MAQEIINSPTCDSEGVVKKRRCLQKIKKMLKPFDIQHFYVDDWGAYQRNLNPENYTISKKNTQKSERRPIERKHLTLRTRIKRLAHKRNAARTICFSKSIKTHDIVKWRITFLWQEGNAYEVLFEDYHR